MMKTQKILYSLLCILLSCTAYAQDAITVNGLEIGKHYTPTQIIAALGQPTEIITPQITDAIENMFVYKYNQNIFVSVDGRFTSFSLRDKAFAANGTLRIGDSVSKIDQMGGVKIEETPYQTRGYIIWKPSTDAKYEFTNLTVIYLLETNVIISITASINDIF